MRRLKDIIFVLRTEGPETLKSFFLSPKTKTKTSTKGRGVAEALKKDGGKRK